jgi:Ca2+-transporting ATPase
LAVEMPEKREERWYNLGTDETAGRLDSSAETGLTAAEAASRLVEFGPNVIREEQREHPVKLFFNQFRDFMIYVLLAAAIISALPPLNEYVDSIVIMVIVIANAILGFGQEYRAEKALESLRTLSAPTARVVRGGAESVIPSADLVPGDLILLEAGDRIPADARLLEARYREGRPVEELARREQISLTAMKVRLFRLREALRDCIERHRVPAIGRAEGA